MNKVPQPPTTFVDTIINYGERNTAIGEKEFEEKIHKEILDWAQNCDSGHSSLNNISPCVFVFDFARSEMIHFSPCVGNLVGVDSSMLMGANGLIKFMDLIHPNDFKVYSDQIFPKDMDYLRSLPYKETRDIIFSNNFRVKQPNGLFRTLLMKKIFITGPETRQLLFEAGTLIDISSFKKEVSITHTIEKVCKQEDASSYLKVVTEDYFPEMHEHILSGREKEILRHLSIGTKRKEVGVKLFISDNTVANHIKTILRKTNARNMREAIAICKMNGVI